MTQSAPNDVSESSGAPARATPVDLLLGGGWVLTVDETRRIFRHGAIAVRDGVIVDVGAHRELRERYLPATFIDTSDMVVMPGLINGHRHLLSTPKGAQPDGKTTLENLRDFVYPTFASLSEGEMQAYAMHHTAEMIRFGTTTFEEPGCVHLDAVLESLASSGMRCRVGPWTWDQGGVVGSNCPNWYRLTTDQALARLEEGLATVRRFANPLIYDAVTIEGVGTCSNELTTAAAHLARDEDSLFVLHKASSEQEVRLELDAFGRRPVENMYATGALNEHVFMNHVTSLNLDEVAMIAETGARVGQNPSTALKLSKGTTQTGMWPELLRAGVPMALGTDAENASNHSDLCRAMYLAALLPRDARRDPQAVTAEQAIEMATISGATALRLENAVGSLSVGKQADITAFATDDFDWQPVHNPISSLVYGATGYSVDTVVIAGRIVLRGGVHTLIDLDEVHARVREADARVLRDLDVIPGSPAWPIVD